MAKKWFILVVAVASMTLLAGGCRKGVQPEGQKRIAVVIPTFCMDREISANDVAVT